jgi:ABC-type transporter Mla subunit MlaD
MHFKLAFSLLLVGFVSAMHLKAKRATEVRAGLSNDSTILKTLITQINDILAQLKGGLGGLTGDGLVNKTTGILQNLSDDINSAVNQLSSLPALLVEPLKTTNSTINSVTTGLQQLLGSGEDVTNPVNNLLALLKTELDDLLVALHLSTGILG